ncbi:hypothetical protein J416_11080 [Gracilibacillus halophilus YIM-C55.5]|uniref:Glutaredoxin domain-containing protein n=1 Tax=Gracilibacillus halophilus YIM-C55.5 TaxID=1308866 RepID=N4WJN6_9BACI|nr:hypothetical protein [Gracilibacillus halophilus]ENH96382.1 hypothetical protein J416_11080 [Gracilibacillus halophilus YIM-C55.5]
MKQPQVLVYINHDHESRQLLEFLDDQQVPYQKKDVSASRDYLQELQTYNIYVTPAVVVGKQKILGFQKQRLRDILGLAHIS